MILWVVAMKIDVHQHLWTEPLVEALASRQALPFVRVENGLTVLYLEGERPYVIDCGAERPSMRAQLVERDGLDRALLCLSSPIGIERLPREQAAPLLDAYLDGALALGGPFDVWGAIALDRAVPGDVDRALDRGCVGISLPAGAIASVQALDAMHAVLERLERRGAPLLVHPGPGQRHRIGAGRSAECALGDPLWWPALTRYVADLQAAWLAFQTAGRAAHPHLRMIFSMLAGLAPLHGERLRVRGGPVAQPDPLLFYETSSYGPVAVQAIRALVGPDQILYGSDRPVVEPHELGMPAGLDWEPVEQASRRALGASRVAKRWR
jgi:6-methylsalicylate decarboxylase